MSWIDFILIAVGLSMDAFAVAVSLGLSMKTAGLKNALIVGLYFGVFQAGMPLIGYIGAVRFSERITEYSDYIVFALLVFLGGKMIAGAFKKDEFASEKVSLKPMSMIPFALATSIDALAVGISFGFMQADIGLAVAIIGVTTLILSMLGVKIGQAFGTKYKSKAVFAGGVILVLIGIRALF